MAHVRQGSPWVLSRNRAGELRTGQRNPAWGWGIKGSHLAQSYSVAQHPWILSFLHPHFHIVNRCIKQPFPFKALQTMGRRAHRPSGPLFGNVCAHNKPDGWRFITLFISWGWFGLLPFHRSTPSTTPTRTLQSYRFMVSGRAMGSGRGEGGGWGEVWAWSRGRKEVRGSGGWDGWEQTSNREMREGTCVRVSGSGPERHLHLQPLPMHAHACLHAHMHTHTSQNHQHGRA